MYAPPEKEMHPEQRAFTMALYVIASLGAIVQYAESIAMCVAGFLILALAGFMVKAQRLTARNTIYASHVEWMARTMSIGSVLFALSVIVMCYLVYQWTDVAAFKNALAAAADKDLDAQANLVRSYIDNNLDKIDRITVWSLTPPIFWWVRRCWYGLMRADKSEPIDYPLGIL